MDPLSDVLSLLKPRSYRFGGFEAGGDWSIRFPRHDGIKCYAIGSGQCWLAVEGVDADPVRLQRGRLLPAALGPALPAGQRPGAGAGRRHDDLPQPAQRRHRPAQRRRRLLRRRRALRPRRQPRRRAAAGAAADRPYPVGAGPGGAALVHGADGAGAARAAAGRLPGGAAPGLYDADPGPAAASGGRAEGRRRLAVRPGGPADGRGDQRHARRPGAALDLAGRWRRGPACRGRASPCGSRRPSARRRWST